MRIIYWLQLAFKRLGSQLGLALLSLLGVVLAIGMAASIPVFSQGVSFLVLREELNELSQTARRPPFAVRFYYSSSAKQPLTMQGVQEMSDIITGVLQQRVGLPITRMVVQVETPWMSLSPATENAAYGEQATDIEQIVLTSMQDVGEHISVLQGASFGEMRDDRIGIWVHTALHQRIGLRVGEEYDLFYSDARLVVPIYVAGIWEARTGGDAYWYSDPAVSSQYVLVPWETFENDLAPAFPASSNFDSWYLILDEQAIRLDKADATARGLQAAANTIGAHLPGIRMDYSPLEPLHRYLQRRATLSVLLVGFGLPAMGLLFYFLSLISIVTVLFQRRETTILTGRGAGRNMVLLLSFVETLLLVALGAPIGILAGYLLARGMGYSLSFMTFISRPPLPLSLAGLDWRLLGAAVGVLFIARLLPAFSASRESIVTHSRARARPLIGDTLRKVLIDIVLVAATAYAYWQLRQRGTLAILGGEAAGGDPYQDPLLLLAPTLFVFTAALLMGHLFPVLLRPLDLLSVMLPSFPPYMGLRQLVRQSHTYASNLFLVIVCLSLGAFYSSMALSLDQWLRDRIFYRVGADYAFRQGVLDVMDGAASQEMIDSRAEAVVAQGGWLLPPSEYLKLPGVQHAARVGDYTAVASGVGGSQRGRFIGVDRLDFPLVAYYRSDFSTIPLPVLMNRLGMYEHGLLVSKQFLADNSLLEGQQLALRVDIGSSQQVIEFLIVGTFDYFPTMYPTQEQVFVGNLDYLFGEVGFPQRHQIWLRLDSAADTNVLRERVEKMGIKIAYLGDARQMIAEDESRVERIGLFGILSIGFLAGSVLSCLGLLVYTYASLQGRLHQFSILLAIGARVREVLAIVGVEYLGVIAYGVAVGAMIGVAASYLFVPFFHFTDNPALALPPFQPEIAWGNIGWIALVFALALVFSQLVILYSVTKRNIFQMLRMGERE